MVRFVHFGDTHLGRRNFKLEERERDFEEAFKQVIDFAIRKKVDFVIHSGDVFDTGRPRYRVVNFLVSQLLRLKREGIPFFTIPGSHDVAPDGTLLSTLHKVGLLKNLGEEEYFEKRGEEVILHGESYNGAFIAGVPGRRANISQLYKSLRPELKGDFRILIFHHIISDISGKFSDIEKEVLPRGFDYYAGGHWHSRFETSFNGKPVVYPGSTEVWDVREVGEKGFFYVEDGRRKWIPLKTRKFVELVVNCDGLTPSEVSQKVRERIEPNDGAILLIRLKGRLKEGSKAEINRKGIMDTALERGYLYANIYTSELLNPKEAQVSLEHKSLEEIEKEYLEKKGYKGKELEVGMRLIDLFGKRLTASEIEANKRKLFGMLGL